MTLPPPLAEAFLKDLLVSALQTFETVEEAVDETIKVFSRHYPPEGSKWLYR
jgi:hypothetical protein